MGDTPDSTDEDTTVRTWETDGGHPSDEDTTIGTTIVVTQPSQQEQDVAQWYM